MFSRSALRVALDVPFSPKYLASKSSVSIFPQRAYLHQTSMRTNAQSQSQSQSSSSNSPETPLNSIPRVQFSQPQKKQQQQQQQQKRQQPSNIPTTEDTTDLQSREDVLNNDKLPVQPTFTSPLKITKSLTSMLPHLTTQSHHYITAHLHARPYLLTEGDHLRLPFLMPNVEPGNVIRFNRASALGSRDFTLKGAPYVDERLFECRVRVLGVDADAMSIKEKTKRRQRHVKHVRSKHKHTLMRVMEVRVKTVEELLAEGAVIVEDEGSTGERVEVSS